MPHCPRPLPCALSIYLSIYSISLSLSLARAGASCSEKNTRLPTSLHMPVQKCSQHDTVHVTSLLFTFTLLSVLATHQTKPNITQTHLVLGHAKVTLFITNQAPIKVIQKTSASFACLFFDSSACTLGLAQKNCSASARQPHR